MPTPENRRTPSRLIAALFLLVLSAWAQAWTPGLKEAAEAVANNVADANQKMMVFVHNKELNLMAQEGLVRERAYAVCQDEFNRLNKQFIDKAFEDSGFKPNSSEVKLNPGTDTDINVTSTSGKKITLQDIQSAEGKYQTAIKEHFGKMDGVDKSKIPTNKVDTNTDFMAHPDHTTKDEFKKIADHINDTNGGTAYKDPRAASAQAKLGDKGAKLTIEEAGAFSTEMKDLANKKIAAANDLRKEAGGLRAADPGRAAQLEAQASQYEYQAAKYHSRLTDVNNQLRSQYGLPPKKGAMDDVADAIAKIGRGQYSAAEVKMVQGLHRQALQNSADNMIATMLEVAKKNPASLPQIRSIIAAESKALSAAGAARAAAKLDDAVKGIEAAAKWASFKEAAKDLSGFNATTKVSVVMTAGGAILIGYQGVQIALNDVKATDTVWDFIKNVYIHAGWEGTGIGPAFEDAQKEEIDKYMKEIMAGRDPSMFKHITFTILKTGAYMGRDAIIGILTLPSTIWEAFTQEKEMEAYAAMQNEIAAAMRQMILDRQAYDALMVKMRKMGLHPEDEQLFLNCMCRDCGGMFGGYYNPAGKGEYGHGPCMCSGPLTIWKTPLPTGNKDRMYACFNDVTKLRYDQAQDIFNKWHQQAMQANAESVAKELADIKQEIAKNTLETDEEQARRLADQFAAIKDLLQPQDADWVKAMLGPHLLNHAHKQAEAGNLPRAVDDMDRAIDKVGIRGAQNEADSKQRRDQYKQWDPVWREFKAKKFPEVEALLSKRQIQRAAGELGSIEGQLKDPYSRKLPPAIKDPDFLRLKARVEEQQKQYRTAVQDAWKQSSELQKANDPRAAADVLEKIQKEWEHPQDTVNGFQRQIAYDREQVAKADMLRKQGQTAEEGGSLALALEKYEQSVAIQRDAGLEAHIGKLKGGRAKGTALWNEGKALFDAGRAVDALSKFKESISWWPEAGNKKYVAELEAQLTQRKAQAAALWNEGKTLYDAGRPLEALAKFKESLKIWPDAGNQKYVADLENQLTQKKAHAAELWNQGKQLFDSGQKQRALDKFKESLKEWPDAANAQYVRQLEAALAQEAAQQAAAQQAAAQQAAAQAAAQQAAAQAAAQQAAAQQAAAQAAAQQAAAQAAAQQAAQQAAAQAAAQHPEGFYLVDLTPEGGKKGSARSVKGVRVDDGSWIRLKATHEKRLTLDVPLPQRVPAQAIAVVTNLDNAHYVKDKVGTTVLTVHTTAGDRSFEFRAGVHSSEWNRGESGGADHAFPQATYIGDKRWMAVFTLPAGSVVTGMRFDHRDFDRKIYHSDAAPGFCLRGITLITGAMPAETVAVAAASSAGGSPAQSPATSPGPAATSRNDPVIVEIGNIGGVDNAPTKATTVTFNQSYLVTFIQTYHWNHAKGARPGTVGLRDAAGRMYGPWQMSGAPGQGGVPNAYWRANPNVVLPAGTYTVIDSDPATWAQNGGSGGVGFVRIEGRPAGGGRDYTSRPRDEPVPSSGPTKPFQLDLYLANESRQPVHLFVEGKETFGPQNKVPPGGKRAVTVAVEPRGATFVAGRDGNRLASCHWDGAGIPIVVFNDPARLSCAIGPR